MTNTCEYQQQAIDFLKTTNSFLSIKYNRQADRFNSGTPTDVYTCELSNDISSYQFDFSQSINNSNLYERKTGLKSYDYKGETIRGILTSSVGDVHNYIFNESKTLGRDYFTESEYNKFIVEIKRMLKIYKNEGRQAKMLNDVVEFLFKKNEIKAPTEYDILACLNVTYSTDFADFTEEFGYSLDSANEVRQAQKTFNAVRNESRALNELFNEEQIEMLHEIC